MLYNGPITEATQQANHTGLPQVLVVGEPSHHSTFLTWVAANHLEQFAIISVIYKGTEEETQLDQVVAERGIVPRVHIIPPQGRGLTPTCLYKNGFQEDIVAQAIATAGGIMMSHADVIDTIGYGFVEKELRNASAETQRTVQRLFAKSGPMAVTSPTSSSAVASPNSASAAATSTPQPATTSRPASAAIQPAKAPTTTAPQAVTSSAATTTPTVTTANTLPNVKISLKLADGKAHAVYTNNLWNAATQLAKGGRFCLELGKNSRAFTAEEMQSLPIVEGSIVRLNLDPPGQATPVASPTVTNDNDNPSPAVSTPATSSLSTTQVGGAQGGSVEIRLTLPTGVNQQVTFSPTSTLMDVRNEVANQFLSNNKDMASYCQSNGLSSTDFTLVVAYPPKKLENNPETNQKTLQELNLGNKFALRVVMAFLGGGGGNNAGTEEGAAAAQGSGIMGRVGGWLRGAGQQQQPQQ